MNERTKIVHCDPSLLQFKLMAPDNIADFLEELARGFRGESGITGTFEQQYRDGRFYYTLVASEAVVRKLP